VPACQERGGGGGWVALNLKPKRVAKSETARVLRVSTDSTTGLVRKTRKQHQTIIYFIYSLDCSSPLLIRNCNTM
jgi:hypothetical protein